MDLKSTSEPTDANPRSPAAGDGGTQVSKDENASSSSGATKCVKSYDKEFSASNTDVMYGIEGNIIKSHEGERSDKKSVSKTSLSGENSKSTTAQDSSLNAQALDGCLKKRSVQLKRKHLHSLSLPTHASVKRVTVPMKRKAPVIIRNISTVPAKESDFDDDDDDSDSEIESNVRSEEESPSKTIIISQSPTFEDTKETSHLVLDHHSEDTVVTDGGSISSKSKFNFESTIELNKKVSAAPSPSSSQASPYNTRFAHMKIGTIFPISKRKADKSNANTFCDNANQCENTSFRFEKSSLQSNTHDSGVCFLCGIPFADDMGISLSVKKPLPLSSIDLVSLLESFSISCASVRTQNLNYVNICNVCHTLIIDGDAAYKQILSVATEMKEHWPYRAQKKNPVFSLTVPENSPAQLINNENVSENVLSSQKQEPIHSEEKKSRGRVGRPPKIKIKHEDEADINWRPSQVKLERTTHTGRRGRPAKRKIKREKKGRPRKVAVGEVSEDEVYTCGLCSETFCGESEWGTHYESVHKTQLRWVNYRLQKKLKKLILWNIQESFLNDEFTEITCHACDSKFFEKYVFVDHLRIAHKMLIDDEFITALYNFSQGHFENEEALSESDTEKDFNTCNDGTVIKIERDVLSSEKPEKSVKCKVCHLLLDSEKALKEHTDTNHFSLVVISNDDSREVVLPEEKVGNQKEGMKEEQVPKVAKVTDKENIDDDDFLCEECQEAFDSRHDLLEHKLNIHGSNDDKGQEGGLVRYECEVCGRRIYGLAALKVHMTKVHYKTVSSFKFSCSMCIYKSQSRSHLGKHMRGKHGKEIMPSVQCETCGKMYGSSYIAKHIATMHSTHPRNFECNFCDMKFYDMAGLKFHIYHEHANKIWKCNKCPMEFKKYHQLRQHGIFTHSTKVHACMECPKTYKRKSDLTEHVKRLHLQRVVLLCPRCPKQYVNRFKLRNHLMKHHDVPWEDTLARNYARHQRANNCRRTEDGILEANKEKAQGDENSKFMQEPYDHFSKQEEMQEGSDHLESHGEEQEYHEYFKHEYHSHYRQSNDGVIQQNQQRPHQLETVKMEKDDQPEEYIEIMEATDSFAKDGITYVIIEET